MSKQKQTYESALKEISEISRALDEQSVNMDELPQKVKRASELIQWCKKRLRDTEQQLGDLLEDNSSE